MLKKITAISVAVLMVLSQLIVSAATFSDVDPEKLSWAAPQIEEMVEKKIINGFEDGTFRPTNGVSRIDSLLLISRILGANDEAEEKIITFAENNFYSTVNLLKYPNYQKNLAYILYRNMFTPEELSIFLQNDLGQQTLKRYEAAVLLVKMSPDANSVSKDDVVELPFDDAEEIPEAARPHVYYCYEKGLMKGMGENMFEPMGEVTRAQMAVMLYNAMKGLYFDTVVGTVESVSGFDNSVDYIDENGIRQTFSNDGLTRITLDGEDITDIDFINDGDIIHVHSAGGKIFLVEILAVLKDEIVEGVYAGKGASSTITKLLIRPNGSSSSDDVSSYIVSEDVKVYIAGVESSLSALKSGDHVKLTIVDSLITEINVAARESSVTGYITGFDYDGQGKIDIRLSDNTVKSFALSFDTVVIKRNGSDATARELKVGDKVTLNLSYDEIIKVVATSTKKTYEGTIEEIVISKTNPKIKINIGKEVIECAMDNSIEITINDEEADIYDVKLGYSAKVQTDSTTVTKIDIVSTPTIDNVNIMGTVLEVNSNYASLAIQLDDGTTTQLFVKKNATIINGVTGRATTFAAIKPGNVITAVITSSGFTAEAISIVVLDTSK